MFFDNLKHNRKTKVSKLFFKSFITNKKDTTEKERKKLLSEEYFSKYEGKVIDTVIIIANNIYDKLSASENKGKKILNSLHYPTRTRIIRRNLLFKAGDKVNSSTLIRNEQLLRSLRYISNANIYILNNDSDGVNIYVTTQDSWTASANIIYEKSNRINLELFEGNMFGSGNKLTVGTYLGMEKGIYGGNQFEYDISNFYGTFFDVNLILGKGFEKRVAGISADKKFILPNDYAGGFKTLFMKGLDRAWYTDSTYLISGMTYDFWAGKSFGIKSIKGGLFVTGGYQNINVYDRPDEVSATLHPKYHDYTSALFSLGLYKEMFYPEEFVYGYGVIEDIPHGFKIALTSGYRWGEFSNNYYLGTETALGGYTKLGYLRGEISSGLFLNEHGVSNESVLSTNFNFFSKLLNTNSRTYVRQFLNFNMTLGFNRLEGETERLRFYSIYAPRALQTKKLYGLNRVTINTETIFFTPHRVLGFNIAIFNFVDFGWIGDSYKVFKNDFYSSLGLGIRIKNERLIFNILEIRLGVALNKNGFYNSDYIKLSSQPKLMMKRFIPGKPGFAGYN